MAASSNDALTVDKMREVVEQEGIEARNLLNWNVPVSGKNLQESDKIAKKPPVSPRPQSASPKPLSSSKEQDSHFRMSKRCHLLNSRKSRVRSASAGRSPEKNLRARYWAFLFENLYRAVDEIYQTCEMDESIVESKEAILMLENYSKEFQALIQWLNISKNYESTQPPNRPASLAWEIRKTLPSKGLLRSVFLDKMATGSSLTKRVLNFDASSGGKISKLVQTDSCNESGNANTTDFATDKMTVETESSTDLDDKSGMHFTKCINSEISKLENVATLNSSEHSLNSMQHLHEEPKTSKNDNVKGACNSDVNRSKTTTDKCLEEDKCSLLVSDDNNLLNSNDDVNNQHKNSKSPCNENTVVIKTNTSDVKSENLSADVICCHEKSISNNIIEDVNQDSPLNNLVKVCNNLSSTSNNNNIASHSSVTLKSEDNDSTLLKTDSPVSFPAKEVVSNINVNDAKFVKKNLRVENSNRNNRAISSKRIEEINNFKNNTYHSSVQQKVNVERISSSSQATRLKIGSSLSASNTVEPKPQRPASTLNKLVKNQAAKNTLDTKRYNENSLTVERKPFRTGRYEPNSWRTTGPANTSVVRKPFIKSSSVATSSSQNFHSVQTKNNTHFEKNPQKTGSSSSLSSTSSSRSWADKVKGMHSEHNADVAQNSLEDADGWETVKSRTRCRNSPCKRLSPSHDINQVALAAKINQSKMGGFPYTCTSNSSVCKSKAPTAVSHGTKAVKEHVEESCTLKENADVKNNMKDNSVNSKPLDSKKTTKEKLSLKSVSAKANTIAKKDAVDIKGERKLNTNKTATKTSGVSSKGKEKTTELKNSLRKALSQRQRSSEDIPLNDRKQKNLSNSLKKTKSSVTFEVKKKSITSSDRKMVSNSCSQPSLGVSSSSCTSISEVVLNTDDEVGNRVDVSVSNDSGRELENCSLSKEVTDKLESSCLTDVEKNKYEIKDNLKQADVESEHAKIESDEVFSEEKYENNQNFEAEESDVGIISDDQDGATSQDEASYEVQMLETYEKLLRDEAQEHVHELGLSWGDQMDRLDLELRTPGRALQMHEKLSSPFRKRTLSETIRRHEERQLKAQEQRERLLEEKAQRFKDIQKKAEEMKALKEKRQEKQRTIMEQKLQRAEEKRKKQLEKIVKKAHDEEEKVNEIAFINTLEAQNKRHDILSKEKDHEARLQDIQDERQRRLEEKAAKEAAAEERRKVLEAERQARLLEMQEKRKLRDQKIEQQFLDKEKERQELANQKARDRELRREALNAAQQATVEELQKKIQLKQEESARRHEENIEQIRQKAFELSVRRYSSYNDDAPQLVPYETKKICTICNVLIGSDVYLLSHLRGKKHQETVKDQHQGKDPSTEELELYNLKHIVDVSTDHLDPNIALDKERQKALKKRCKKLRQRMTNRGLEYEASQEKILKVCNSTLKPKIIKITNEIKKWSTVDAENLWNDNFTSSCEKVLSEMEKVLSKCTVDDKNDFRVAGGITAVMNILNIAVKTTKNNNVAPQKKFVTRIIKIAEMLFENCWENCIYILYSNKVGVSLDILIHRLNNLIPDNYCQVLVNSSGDISTSVPIDSIAGELMHFLGVVFSCIANNERVLNLSQNKSENQTETHLKEEGFKLRILDIISYIVSIGIVDRLSQYFNNIRRPINTESDVAMFLLNSTSFLISLVKLSSESYDCVFDRKKTEDITQLVATLKVTDMIGAVSLLYCILLNGGVPCLGEAAPQRLPVYTENVALSVIQMINYMAAMNLHVVQNLLGSEGLSLQLRHIACYLLWYCSHWTFEKLCHEIILLVGYFTVLNPDNQLMIQAGQRPTVLQQLCLLPFQYFSDEKLTEILFPTLIACCYNSDSNKAILKQEMSCELIANYIEAQMLEAQQTPVTDNKNKKFDLNLRWKLRARFPKEKWSTAQSYFI